jgi:O-antigen biosynthesis protein
VNGVKCIDHYRADTVKARLLPLSPTEAAMERFIEMFPRRRITATLTALDSIAVIDEAKGEYKSTGADPCFVLGFGDQGHQAGWYYIEAALVRHNGSRVANLRVEMVDPLDRQFDWPVTTNLRGSIREVVYLPSNVTRLLWFPTGAPGFFSQSPLMVHKISFVESVARRLHRVIDTRGKVKGNAAVGNQWPGSSAAAGAAFWSTSGRGVSSALTNLQTAYRRTVDFRIGRTRGNDYAAFLARIAQLDLAAGSRIQKQTAALIRPPQISLLTVLRDPKRTLLCKMLDSVATQVYAHWELCIAVDASVPPEIMALLIQRQATDARIKLLADVPGASVADGLHHALLASQGEFGAHVGQHDVIHAHALAYVAIALAAHSDTDLMYSDDDRTTELDVRSDPAFKPDWNPDLLLSHNYISGLAVYRRSLAVAAGGYRNGFDESEDYDLLLRLSRTSKQGRIRHIAKVLYSHRDLRHEAKTDVSHLSGLRALQDHLLTFGAQAVAGAYRCFYRVKHPLPEQLPLVTLIIPTRDKVEILKKCIESIQQKTDYGNWEMLVVDNGSTDPATHRYFREMEQDTRIRLLVYSKPFNYSAINNFAVESARGEVLGLLNNDLEVISPEWLSEMVSHAVRPEIGAVGAKLLYPDGMVQHAGVVLGIGGVAGHVHRYLPGDDAGYCHRASVTQNLSAVTGACLLVRKALYQEVGGLNATHLAVAFNDIDLCLKLRDAGYRNLYTPHALLTHHESISRGRDDTEEKSQTFKQEYTYMQNTWRNKLRDDPAYNVNLSLEFENCAFAEPYTK